MKNHSVECRVLLVEDDANLGLITQEALQLQGFQVTLIENGVLAWDAFADSRFDICIIDVMLPQMDGFTLAEKIRGSGSQIPIIFLTARAMKQDRIQGFKIGGDDYLTKPFSMEELVLRIQAVLRRVRQPGKPSFHQVFHIGEYNFHFDKNLLIRGHHEKKLTFREAELLCLLCEHQNKILDRELALIQVWGNNTFFTARSMDVYISHLRKYLQDDPTVHIVNVHGKGFKLTVD
jgi:two-component system, OmpR family, response regulator